MLFTSLEYFGIWDIVLVPSYSSPAPVHA